MLTAQPSPAHEALAHLEQAGKLRAILTVNIDGIHQEAGSREVLELHGSVMRSWCAKCEKFLDFFYIADSPTHIPYCNVDMCGDYVRPAIVLKEEPYDLALLEKALDYVRAADVLIIDGSALKEFPVPNLMQAYQRHKLVLVNTAPWSLMPGRASSSAIILLLIFFSRSIGPGSAPQGRRPKKPHRLKRRNPPWNRG
ncbi:MAG: Sir2 family NAD-dependent protein deacetylase [Evtepia gabavorous]